MIDYRENNKWKVYIHIVPQNINGHDWDKYYIGITSQNNIKLRWGKGSHYKNCTHFYRAVQKYGWDNMKHEVIAENLTKQEACDFEKRLIKELKSNDYNFGYNISSGGSSGNFGVPTSQKQKEAASATLKRLWKNPEYIDKLRFNHTEESRKKQSEFMKQNSPTAKMVVCMDTNELFKTIIMASSYKGTSRDVIAKYCKLKQKPQHPDKNGNYYSWRFYDDYLKENNLTDDEARKSLFFIE